MANHEYEAIGTLYKKLDAEQITERFRKRELILELPGRYPQTVSFELTGDRCELLDDYEVGEEIRVIFRLKGREWTGRGGEVRYFNSLDVLELGRLGAQPGPAADPSVESAMFGGGQPAHPASPNPARGPLALATHGRGEPSAASPASHSHGQGFDPSSAGGAPPPSDDDAPWDEGEDDDIPF